MEGAVEDREPALVREPLGDPRLLRPHRVAKVVAGRVQLLPLDGERRPRPAGFVTRKRDRFSPGEHDGAAGGRTRDLHGPALLRQRGARPPASRQSHASLAVRARPSQPCLDPHDAVHEAQPSGPLGRRRPVRPKVAPVLHHLALQGLGRVLLGLEPCAVADLEGLHADGGGDGWRRGVEGAAGGGGKRNGATPGSAGTEWRGTRSRRSSLIGGRLPSNGGRRPKTADETPTSGADPSLTRRRPRTADETDAGWNPDCGTGTRTDAGRR